MNNADNLEPTCLYLSKDEFLCLPKSGTSTCSLDQFISSIPRVASRSDELFKMRPNTAEEEDNHYQVTVEQAHEPRQNRCPLNENKGNKNKCVNVLQGEVAHATPSQTDVIMSADATTCHIVALRSMVGGSSEPLASLAHVDSSEYGTCLEEMVKEHLKHHNHSFASSNDDQCFVSSSMKRTSALLPSPAVRNRTFPFENDNGSRSSFLGRNMCGSNDSDDGEGNFGFFLDEDDEEDNNNNNIDYSCSYEEPLNDYSCCHEEPLNDSSRKIEMDLHLVGGYHDMNGKSQELSTFLLTTFCDLASKYQQQVQMTLQTAAISCMNNSSSNDFNETGEDTTNLNNHDSQAIATLGAPRARGLGINTHTGEVFIINSIPEDLIGPAIDVRSARAWHNATTKHKHDQPQQCSSEENNNNKLQVIKDSTSDTISIQPFQFQPFNNLDILLQLPDEILLKVTSTSPNVESNKFCDNVRNALKVMKDVPCTHVFGPDCSAPLVYSRSEKDLASMNEWVAN